MLLSNPIFFLFLSSSALARSFAKTKVTAKACAHAVEVALAFEVFGLEDEAGGLFGVLTAHGFATAPAEGSALALALAFAGADAGVGMSWLLLPILGLIDHTLLRLDHVVISQSELGFLHFIHGILNQLLLFLLVNNTIYCLHRLVLNFRLLEAQNHLVNRLLCFFFDIDICQNGRRRFLKQCLSHFLFFIVVQQIH